MGYLYDDDFYYDGPSEFEERIDNFKEQLRKEVKTEFLSELETLKKKLEDLESYKQERDKFIAKYEQQLRKAKQEVADAQREARQAEMKYKNTRLKQLLGDYTTTGWYANTEVIYQPKCDKCNDDRFIEFLSPQGNLCKERCNCNSILMRRYYSVEAKLVSFTTAYDTVYYQLESQFGYKDEYQATFCASIHPEGSTDYSQVLERKTIFMTEEDCKNFCDYMNKDNVLNTIPATSKAAMKGD